MTRYIDDSWTDMEKRNVLKVVWMARAHCAPLSLSEFFLALFSTSVSFYLLIILFSSVVSCFFGGVLFSVTFLYHLHLLQWMSVKGHQSTEYIALISFIETFEKNKCIRMLWYWCFIHNGYEIIKALKSPDYENWALTRKLRL